MSKTSKALVVVKAAAAGCFLLAAVNPAWLISGVALLVVGRMVSRIGAELNS